MILAHAHILGFCNKNVNEDVAVSHHYRICENDKYECWKLPSMTDRVAHRWAKQLFNAVKEACDGTFGKDAGCPEAPPHESKDGANIRLIGKNERSKEEHAEQIRLIERVKSWLHNRTCGL